MDKEKVVFRATPWIVLLALPLLFVDVLWLWGINIHLEQTGLQEKVGQKHESLGFLLQRLIKGEVQKKVMENRGLVCVEQVHSKHCVVNRPLQLDTATMTITIQSNQSKGEETITRPYARQEDHILLKTVSPVKVILKSSITSICEYIHDVPVVVFSSSGFTGNAFHEFNEIIIPLFITTSLFKTKVQFVVEDYKPSFVTKYAKVLARLTSHEIINPATNQSVHCFPGGVIGLNFHYHLSLNPTKVPTGLSMPIFRQFLRESLNLHFTHVSQIKTPTVMLLSRTKTRRILNEDQVVAMMTDLGFRVVIVRRAKVVSKLEVFSRMINSCSVLVGAHGAGLTNEIFLPDGAVMVQLDLIGLHWAARTYYGDRAGEMGLHYLRYNIEAEESSLFKVFGSRADHIVFTDPKGAFPVEAGKEVYLNGQNVIINVDRFRNTMVEAMSLVRDSPV